MSSFGDGNSKTEIEVGLQKKITEMISMKIKKHKDSFY